jgi:hypothetical protein
MLVVRDNKNRDDREESTLEKGHCMYGGWSVMELLASTSCTTWFLKTVHAHK